MRVVPLLVVLPIAALACPGEAAPPPDNGTARSFAASDFTGIEARGADDVEVRVGPGFSVRAVGPRAALDTLDIGRVGETLRIARRRRNGVAWSGGGRVKIYVTMPRIAAASLAGSGDMAIDRVEGQRFDASSAGSGDLTIATLRVPQASLSIAGSGAIRAAGSVEQLKVSIAGSGNVAGAGLRAHGAVIAIDGSGAVTADVTGMARVSINGSGHADLGRGAHCTISRSGSGSARCGG